MKTKPLARHEGAVEAWLQNGDGAWVVKDHRGHPIHAETGCSSLRGVMWGEPPGRLARRAIGNSRPGASFARGI